MGYLKSTILGLMENYENSMIIHNNFSDNMLRDEFSEQLLEYASIRAEEDGGHWVKFKEYTQDGTITWEQSGFSYRLYLQETIDSNVITDIFKSSHYDYINLDMSEWEEEYQELMMLDIIWKAYLSKDIVNINSNKSELVLSILRNKSDGNSIFNRITYEDIKSLVNSLENFDEKEIKLWIKLK
jgi:hypothetical protein